MQVALAHTYGGSLHAAADWMLDGSVGVSVFFAISGFVLPLSLGKKYEYRHLPTFFAKRFLRIEPTFLVSCLVAAVILYTKTRLSPNGVPWVPEPMALAAHFLYVIPFTSYSWLNEVYWTLAIEFQFYVVLALIFPLVRRLTKSTANFCVASVAFGMLTFLAEYSEPVGLVKHSPFFAMGFAAYGFHIGVLRWRSFVAVVMVLVTMGSFGSHELKNLLFAAAATFAFFAWSPRKTWLRFFGTISFSLYVIHYPIVTAGNQMARVQEVIPNPIVATSVLAMSVFLSWAVYKLVEEPSQKLSGRLRYSNIATVNSANE